MPVDRARGCDRFGKHERQIPPAGSAGCALSSPGSVPDSAADAKKGDTGHAAEIVINRKLSNWALRSSRLKGRDGVNPRPCRGQSSPG